MGDDYLWNGSGTPDPDVARIETALERLRAPLPPIPAARLKPSRSVLHAFGTEREASAERHRMYTGIRFLAPTLAAAAAIVLMVAGTWGSLSPTRSWEVARVSGEPRVEATPLTGTGRIAVGETLATDAASRARMEVSSIGQVSVDTDTRVRLVETRKGRHQLALERGTLHAFITAPPGQFVVNTPSSTATDLGCVYTLHVDEDGTGLLSVTAGWVAFEYKGRESFVPARASARTDPEFGPGTPRYDDASEEFRAALDRFDYGPAAGKAAALAFVLEHARDKDAMTLWHLLSRVDAGDRPAVADALERRIPMPAGLTRDEVLALRGPALDMWWDALGLRDATWWRKWKRDRIW
jgi:hypothetical protein